MIRFGTLLIITSILLISCKTEFDVRKGNVAPEDPTVSMVVQKSFINKVYISLLNRKPSIEELKSSLEILSKDNVSAENRTVLINQVLSQPEYFDNLQTQARAQFLESVDEDKIFEYLGDFKLLLTNESQEVFFDIWEDYVKGLNGLMNISSNMRSGKLTLPEMHKLCVDNWVYNQINMGSENFVISCFQHFMNRYPTEYELAQSKALIEGRSGILFLTSGTSKRDFLTTFFSSNNYLEGQVRQYYQKFLIREPSESELFEGMHLLNKKGDFNALQRQLLSSLEFAGMGS